MGRNAWTVAAAAGLWLGGCHGLTPSDGGPTTMTQPVQRGFVSKTLVQGDEEFRYAVYVPADYTPTRSWPLVLFLHGIGERGTDGVRPTEVGIGPAIREHPERFPCIVVMPQCRPQKLWPGEMADVALRMVDAATVEYCVDQDRVSLTGLSMGGFGTWRIGAAHAHRFSSLVPVCGGGDAADADVLSHLPIWCWHGDSDSVVPVERSREMVDAVRAAGGNVQYTELKGVGHNSWDPAYGDAALIAWMLTQQRGG